MFKLTGNRAGSTAIRFAAKTCIALGIGLAASVTSAATSSSEMNFSIRGRVRTICQAELKAAGSTVAPGVVNVGRISEVCNDAQGYSVKLTYAPELGGKTVKIDSQEVVLSGTGETIIYQSSDPDVREHDLALLADVTDLSAYHIGVAIAPKGAIY